MAWKLKDIDRQEPTCVSHVSCTRCRMNNAHIDFQIVFPASPVRVARTADCPVSEGRNLFLMNYLSNV